MVQYFVSYSRENQKIVERLRTDLQNSGFTVWIDKVGLQPGTPDWDDALRIAIRESEAVLLIASPNSRRSAYVRDEIALAKAAKKPIYPVWVSGDVWIDCIPMGLGSTQNVDLRADNYAINLQVLIATLRGQETEFVPIVPEQAKELPIVKNPRNPYKGLKSFRSEDSGDFFGRSELIENLLSLIDNSPRQARFLAVLGASGSGKSSVMMAGVLPRLKEQNSDLVFLDTIVPGNDPLDKLTVSLARKLGNKSHTTIRQDLMNRNTDGLNMLTREISDAPVVLYIDQFEEVFTLVEKEEDRRHFIELITTATTNPNGVLFVLLSMRADFYDRPAKYRNFGSLIEKHHALVTPMSLADLFDAVQKPAQLPDVGMYFDEGLVTDMVFSVRAESASLPLLQFTLDQLFEKRDGNRLALQAYETLGGVQGALAQQAEATYLALPSEKHQALARALFLRLIEPGNSALDTTRRRATYEELTLADTEQTRLLKEVADIFVDARLLVGDLSNDKRTVEVSHEALIREWKRLGTWLYDAREDLQTQRSLSAIVAEWKRRDKPDDMLYRGVVLETAQDWATRNPANRDEMAFISLSAGAESARLQREQRNRRNLRLLAVGFVTVIVLASLGLAMIFAQNNAELQEEATRLVADAGTQVADAEEQQANAETQVADADIQVADAGTQVADAEEQQANAETQVAGADIQVADAGTQVADAEEQQANAEAQANLAQNQIIEAQGTAGAIETSVAEAEAQATSAREILGTANADALHAVETSEAIAQGTSTQQAIIQGTAVAQTQSANATATAFASIIDSNSDWAVVERDFDGVTMVLVPAGCFQMGSNFSNAEDDEQPVTEICFDAPFWIDQYEVTNEQYGSTGCEGTSSAPNQPRNCINWVHSRDYCQSRNARLPTEAEWEYAARGPNNLLYPWGNAYHWGMVIGGDDSTYGSVSAAPVGSRLGGISWVGAFDMSGNLWEWTSSRYEDYPYDASDGRESTLATNRVLRGGAYTMTSGDLRSANRFRRSENSTSSVFGFRCARDYES